MALDQKLQDFLRSECNLCARAINPEDSGFKKIVVVLLRNNATCHHHDV